MDTNRDWGSFPRQGYDDYSNTNNNMTDNRMASENLM
ncbi:unnamed protein product, partial [Oppiella nova]